MALMGPLDEGWPEHSGGRPSGHGGWTMLHALARQLADEYSVAVTGAGSGVALRTLLPNVEHYSIGVISLSGRIVASSHQATAGPSVVSFHGHRTSCMGIAASKRKTIVSTVSTGDGAWVSFLTDVSEMVDASKSCTHFICTPFFDYDSGIKGALLVGLSGQPALPSVRTPILARLRVLAQLLSLALRHTAPAALCTIETVLGNHSGCEFCRRSESSVGSPRESIDAGSENDYEGSLRDEEDGGDDEESEEEEEEDYWRGGRPVERPVTPNTPIGIAHRLRISDSSARLTGCGSLTDSELELLPSRLSSSKAFCTESFLCN